MTVCMGYPAMTPQGRAGKRRWKGAGKPCGKTAHIPLTGETHGKIREMLPFCTFLTATKLYLGEVVVIKMITTTSGNKSVFTRCGRRNQSIQFERIEMPQHQRKDGMPMGNFTPAWFKKGFFNESLFCDDFLSTHQLIYVNSAFFTPEGRVTDTLALRCEIFEMLREYVGANIAKKVSNIVDVLKLAAQADSFSPVTDRIFLANGTLHLDGTFQQGKPEIVRNRLPIKYDPNAAQPVHWLRFDIVNIG